jgi:hypothetical protein
MDGVQLSFGGKNMCEDEAEEKKQTGASFQFIGLIASSHSIGEF